jgi:hypothetical protein
MPYCIIGGMNRTCRTSSLPIILCHGKERHVLMFICIYSRFYDDDIQYTSLGLPNLSHDLRSDSFSQSARELISSLIMANNPCNIVK